VEKTRGGKAWKQTRRRERRSDAHLDEEEGEEGRGEKRGGGSRRRNGRAVRRERREKKMTTHARERERRAQRKRGCNADEAACGERRRDALGERGPWSSCGWSNHESDDFHHSTQGASDE
jgi:hypothetical protein